MNRRTKCALIILAAVLGAVSIGITIYPIISNQIWEAADSKVLTEYTETVEDADSDDLEAVIASAQSYNEKLRNEDAAAEDGYYDELNLSGSGLMAYLEIPKIDLYIPVYHGTDAETLEYGAGHLIGSSLPIGGEGTHSVIAAHSGMANRILFSDLDQMAVGDVFYIHVLNETLAYQVVSVNTVLPEDTSLIEIEDGQDYCTLVTCTPYGVNTHRLLVKGTRIPYEETVDAGFKQSDTVSYRSNWRGQYLNGLLIGIGMIAVVTATVIIIHLRNSGRKRGRHV